MAPVPENIEDKAGIFLVNNAIVTAGEDIYWEHVPDFENITLDLIASDNVNLVLDLSQVSFISSSFLGVLSIFILRAKRAGKNVKIKVSIDIIWIFEIMGPDDHIDIEVV